MLATAVVSAGFFVFLRVSTSLSSKENIFVVNRGESIYSIAKRLEKEKIIRNKFLFLIYLKLTGNFKNIQAGSFRLVGTDNLSLLAKRLSEGRIDKWVTILEGWRREEIAEKLAEELNIDKEVFMKATLGKEGYLFPDSYLFPFDVSVSQIVEIMETNFKKKWGEVEKEGIQTDLSQKQILTLASLVEREARSTSDRKLVAGVLLNRLKHDWPLQVDATVQYAKVNLICQSLASSCDWWQEIKKGDLAINSPYNTYLKKGLPPFPICNPSYSSVLAVVNFQPTDYWFYLSDKQGQIHFARTYEEHQKNIVNFSIDGV